MDDADTLHRRARLRELISACFDGKDVLLLDYIESKTGKRPNQGELSGLKKDHGSRSFAAKKAATLEAQIGLPRFWFTAPLGNLLDRHEWGLIQQHPVANLAQEPTAPYGTTNVTAGPDVRGYVPLISSVQAGEWAEIAQAFRPEDAELWLPCPVKHSKLTFCLRVEGESMKNPGAKPSYEPGDLIFVDPDKSARPGDRVVAKLDDQPKATFKQYMEEDGRKLLKALNPDWKPRYLEFSGNASLCGVVIGKWVPE